MMEESPKETLVEKSNKPTITEYALIIAVIILIIYKYQEKTKREINGTDKANYMNGIYDRIEVPGLNEVPLDYSQK